MATCNIANRALFFLSGGGVYHRDNSGQSRQLEHQFDVTVVLLLRGEWEQLCALIVFVSLNDFGGNGIQGNTNRDGSALFGLSGNVLNRPINDVAFGHRPQVAHTATNQALKYKYISLTCEVGVVAEIKLIEVVALINGDVIRRAINALIDFVVSEWIIVGHAVVIRPDKERTQTQHEIVDGVLPSGFRCSALWDFG